MSRNGRKTRQEQVENTARIAAEAAAAAVLEAAHEDDDDDDEMEESIQPGDDGRPKTLKGRNVPSAGGPSKDVKLGSEGPDAIKKSRVPLVSCITLSITSSAVCVPIAISQSGQQGSPKRAIKMRK